MTTPSASARPWWRRPVTAWVALALAVVLVIAGTAWQQKRERDVRVDELYCTLSGVHLLDRAPNTGRLCADLLYD